MQETHSRKALPSTKVPAANLIISGQLISLNGCPCQGNFVAQKEGVFR
jgi:hypothetical protein